jgi:hypothetical protein
MSQRIEVINENLIVVDGIKYSTHDDVTGYCFGCDFFDLESEQCSIPNYGKHFSCGNSRSDDSEVIWKKVK